MNDMEEAIAGSYAAAPDDWKDRAQTTVHTLLTTQSFLVAEDVWKHIEMPPNGGSALGGVMRRCAKLGWMELTGETRQSSIDVQHSKPMRVWRSKIHPDYDPTQSLSLDLQLLIMLNEDIQDYVTDNGEELSTKLLKMLADLDWLTTGWGEGD